MFVNYPDDDVRSLWIAIAVKDLPQIDLSLTMAPSVMLKYIPNTSVYELTHGGMHAHTRLRTQRHIRMYTGTHKHTHTHASTHTHKNKTTSLTHTHTHTFVYTYTNITHTHTHTHTHAYTHIKPTHARTHIHTHVRLSCILLSIVGCFLEMGHYRVGEWLLLV